MLLGYIKRRCCKLELFELKPRRNRAADKRKCASTHRPLPIPRWHDHLRGLTRQKVRSQNMVLYGAFICLGNLQHKRRAGIEMPDFGGIDPVPMIVLMALQQEIDGCSRRVTSAIRCLAPCFGTTDLRFL